MTPLFRPVGDLVLYLASSSPRRRALLASLGLPFVPLVPQVAEPEPIEGEDPEAYVIRMATLKGRECASRAHSGTNEVFIAADTAVCLEKRILGKPADAAEALEMLRFLNGKSHFVVTGVYCSFSNQKEKDETSFAIRSVVKFARWDESVLAAYAAIDEPRDKAGAYAIQDSGAFLVEGVMGSWTNVAGLPLDELVKLLILKKIIEPI